MKNLWRFVLTGAVVAAVCALPTAFAASRDASPSARRRNRRRSASRPVPRHPLHADGLPARRLRPHVLRAGADARGLRFPSGSAIGRQPARRSHRHGVRQRDDRERPRGVRPYLRLAGPPSLAIEAEERRRPERSRAPELGLRDHARRRVGSRDRTRREHRSRRREVRRGEGRDPCDREGAPEVPGCDHHPELRRARAVREAGLHRRQEDALALHGRGRARRHGARGCGRLRAPARSTRRRIRS